MPRVYFTDTTFSPAFLSLHSTPICLCLPTPPTSSQNTHAQHTRALSLSLIKRRGSGGGIVGRKQRRCACATMNSRSHGARSWRAAPIVNRINRDCSPASAPFAHSVARQSRRCRRGRVHSPPSCIRPAYRRRRPPTRRDRRVVSVLNTPTSAPATAPATVTRRATHLASSTRRNRVRL